MKDTFKILNLNQYVKTHAFAFRPDLPMLILSNIKHIVLKMNNRKGDTNLVSAEDCSYCKKVKNGKCRKHFAISTYPNVLKNKMGLMEYKGLRFQLFGDYALVQMDNDPDGVYLIWFMPIFMTNNLKSPKIFLFALNKKYFKGLDLNQGKDITEHIFKHNLWQSYKNYCVSLDDPYYVENIKLS